jgi:hypothetical protein
LSKLDLSLKGFAIGIRFRPNFSIEDQLGCIVDKILYTKKSFFGPEFFPLVRNLVGKKILINEKTKNRMTINNVDLTLEIGYDFDDSIISSFYSKVLRHFEAEIIKGVLGAFGVQDIIRIGLVKNYTCVSKPLSKSFVKKTVGDMVDVGAIDLSFSKKILLNESLRRRGVNDYDNVIFKISVDSKPDDIHFVVDYQRYFSPNLSSSSDIEFKDFSSAADRYNDNNFIKWLSDNYFGDVS